jgi:hypothetical protein
MLTFPLLLFGFPFEFWRELQGKSPDLLGIAALKFPPCQAI